MSFLFLILDHWVISLAAFAALCEISHIIYRVMLHPLSGFPGPMLAGATHLYAIYYDMFLAGDFVKHIAQLHEQYGPVVRIMPDELHVKDLDTYYKIYKVGTDFDKDKGFYANPMVKLSLLCIPGTNEAKKRKDAFNPFFSKAAVRRVEFLCQAKLAQFLSLLKKAAEESTVVDISRGFLCLTADVITDYSYQKDFDALGAKDFRCGVIDAFDDLTTTGQVGTYFRRSYDVADWVANMLPKAVLAKVSPPLLTVVEFQETCRSNIQHLKQNPRSLTSTVPSIFDLLLTHDEKRDRPVPPDEALTAEAVLMLAAGMDTTANALRVGTWHVLSDQRIYRKLKEELRGVMPDRDEMVDSASLENLPLASLKRVSDSPTAFLDACRELFPLLAPKFAAGKCREASYIYHTDEKYFENAHSFLPERWLGSNAKELDRNMLSFSRGSRICLGMNLATTELYLTFAHLFRKFDIKVHETTAKDMEWGDFYLPRFKGHLKVLLELAKE